MAELAVVTGTSRGIGRAIALAFAERGLDLALLSRPCAGQAETVERCRAIGVGVQDVACDLSQAEAIDAAAKAIKQPPRVLVNNAAVLFRGPPLWQTDPSTFEQTMAVNVRAPYLMCRAFLPGMLAAGRGRVVHLASISSTLACPQQAAYGVSKWALLGLHRSLSEELKGTGLQSMAVLPGSVRTDMLAQTPFPPDMEPDDVARVVTFAALDAPDAMQGADLQVYG